jgi:hypothetical protein
MRPTRSATSERFHTTDQYKLPNRGPQKNYFQISAICILHTSIHEQYMHACIGTNEYELYMRAHTLESVHFARVGKMLRKIKNRRKINNYNRIVKILIIQTSQIIKKLHVLQALKNKSEVKHPPPLVCSEVNPNFSIFKSTNLVEIQKQTPTGFLDIEQAIVKMLEREREREKAVISEFEKINMAACVLSRRMC